MEEEQKEVALEEATENVMETVMHDPDAPVITMKNY